MKATHTPPDVQVSPADLLRLAALYLSRHGWTQGDYYSVVFDAHTPRACVLGAIAMATYGNPIDLPYITGRPEQADYRAAVRALIAYLNLHSICDVFRWNDAPARTAEQVIAALNAAADRSDRLHQGGGNR